MPSKLKSAVHDVKKQRMAKVFGYYVNDPERYGVVSFDNNGNAISLEENQKNQKVIMLYLVFIFILTKLLILLKIKSHQKEVN